MARAWRTASLIAAEHRMHPEVDGALSERFYVSLWDKPIEGEFNWDWDPDGCEPLSTFVHRAASSVTRILSEDAHEGETVIVAHGGILLVVCALTQARLEHSHRRNAVPLRFSHENGAWTATPL
jgi:broad specificity phosphatase PhoE